MRKNEHNIIGKGGLFHKTIDLLDFNKINMEKISIFFFYLGIIFSFFQINAVVIQDLNWSGQFNPYTTFQLYMSDIMFAFGVLFYGFFIFSNYKRVFFSLGNRYSKLVISAIFCLTLLSYFFSINETITFFWLIQFFKMLIVYLFVVNRLTSDKKIAMLMLYCLAFQALIGILQFLFQSSIGLNFLGESHLGPDVLNVAKIDVGSLKVIRSYGTFTHSNIFGGLMSIGFIFAGYMYLQELLTKKRAYFFLSIIGVGVLLSFSRSAWLATAVSIIIFLSFRRFKITYAKIRNFTLTFLGLTFFGYITGVLNLILMRFKIVGDSSVLERIDQLKTSFHMMLAHPMGVGLGNYTNATSNFSSDKLMPWQFEPVHNVFLLIGTELGVITMLITITAIVMGLLRLFKLLTKIEGKYKCFPIYFSIILTTHLIILNSFDHYFYTNYSANIFLMIVLGIMTNYLMNLEESGVSLK